jgi:hypothetical protein
MGIAIWPAKLPEGRGQRELARQTRRNDPDFLCLRKVIFLHIRYPLFKSLSAAGLNEEQGGQALLYETYCKCRPTPLFVNSVSLLTDPP